MIRRLSIVVLATAALAGCVTDGYYHGGSGDYYYGRPSVDYYYDDYYGGYGYPGWYGGYGYGHGYYGHGYPYYGWHGGYWDYPYYYRPPYRPRPPRPDDDHDGPRTGGNLPPSRVDGGPQGGQQLPRAVTRPRLREGIDRPVWRDPPGDPRPRITQPRLGGSSEPMRVRSPAVSTPIAPRPMVPAPRADSRPPMSGRSAPRERVSRPPASRERDLGQEQER